MNDRNAGRKPGSKNKNGIKRIIVSSSVKPELKLKLESLAGTLQMSRSRLIEDILSKYVDERVLE